SIRDSREGPGHAARTPAGGDALERRHLRHWPGVRDAAAPDARASAGRGARDRGPDARRTALGDPRVPDARRPANPWWRVERVLRGHAKARPGHRGSPYR